MSTTACLCSEEKVLEILSKYHDGKSEYLIPILQDVQEVFGYLPEESLDKIASHVHLSPTKVFGVATFYNQFRLIPMGKHTIKVCRGTACHVRGSKQILDSFAMELNVAPGGTTEDGNFTLETVACIGACSIAPVITIDEDFHGHLLPGDVPKLIKQYKEEA